MTVTIKVLNKGTFNLLRNMENLGLIHMQNSMQSDTENTTLQDKRHNRWLQGCCKNLPGGSVEDFLAACRIDKQRELAMWQLPAVPAQLEISPINTTRNCSLSINNSAPENIGEDN
jgi:hypothetical protein